MRCLNPIELDNRDYETYGDFQKTIVPCGKCEVCRNNDSLSWRVRLLQEYYNSTSAFFVTLTYDDIHLHFERCSFNGIEYGKFPVPYREDVQKFFKRVRKDLSVNYPESKISYFLVSEYTPTAYRPHYHFLIFNLPKFSNAPQVNHKKTLEFIEKKWNNGFIKLDPCNENRVAYCTKYMSCTTIIPPYLPTPFRLMSKGLGKCYLENEQKVNWHRKNLANFYPFGKLKYRLPRYLKDKIFSDDEKTMIKQLNHHDKEWQYSMKKLSETNRFLTSEYVKAVDSFKRKYKDKATKRKLNG